MQGMKTNRNRTLIFIAGCFLSACATQPPPQALRPAPLNPVPVQPVSSSALPPAVGVPGSGPLGSGGLGSVPSAPGPYTPPVPGGAAAGDLQAIPTLPARSAAGVALSDNVSVSPDIDFNRNAVLGSWNIASSGDTCALNLSLTTWNGGFRASTRKCSNATLVSIGAWNQADKQLTLLNAQGGTIARLVASGPNRFDGTTESGGASISVFR